MIKKVQGITLIAALMLIATGAALAAPGGKGEMMRRGPQGEGPPAMGMGPRMAEKLGLDESQRDQLREIMTEHREGELGEQQKLVGERRQALEALVHDATADEAQVLEAARALATEAEELALLRHRMAKAVAEILTEEQQETLSQLRAEKSDRGPRRKGRRGPRGFGG